MLSVGIHDKENNSSVEEQENMGIINEEGYEFRQTSLG